MVQLIQFFQMKLFQKNPKECAHYTCKACISIDSVMKIKIEKNFPRIYLEECKYKKKEKKNLLILNQFLNVLMVLMILIN